MGFRVGNRDDLVQALRRLFRGVALTAGTLVMLAVFGMYFDMKPSLLTVMLSGGIAGVIGHGLAEGSIAILNAIWPRGGTRKKKLAKKVAKPTPRRNRRPLEPLDDE